MNQPTFRDVYRPYLIVADFPGELPRVIGRTTKSMQMTMCDFSSERQRRATFMWHLTRSRKN
ncbi:hypothetical protein [Phormidesmis sp. 146-20]